MFEPLDIDSTGKEFGTVYKLMPSEFLNIATYWDDE